MGAMLFVSGGAHADAAAPWTAFQMAGTPAPLTLTAAQGPDRAMPAGAATALHSRLESFTGPIPADFLLPVLDGAPMALQAARGKVVLVHVFATWCEPCREELPALSRLADRHVGTVAVLAIDVGEVDARVRRFFETLPVRFPVLLDRDRSMTLSWGVSALPTTFVLDAGLRPRYRAVGDVAWDEPAADHMISGLVASALADMSTQMPAGLRGSPPAVPPLDIAVTGEPPR